MRWTGWLRLRCNAPPAAVRQLFDASARSLRDQSLALGASQSGATVIEYGLIAASISLACIIALQALGLNLVNILTTINENLV